MRPEYPCPLNDKHCQEIDKALKLAAQARQQCSDMADCGIDMQDMAEQIKAREEILTKLKAKYFPNRF